MVPDNIKEIFRRADSLKNIPAPRKGKRLPAAQAKQWAEAQEAHCFLVDTEPRNDNQIVDQFCVTPQQRKWMNARHLTVESMCQGHYAIGDSAQVHAFYKDWNQKLGVKWFEEEDQMQGMWDSISNTFGGLGVESVQFGDDKPVKLGGTIKERFGDEEAFRAVSEPEANPNGNSTVAANVLKLIQQTKAKLRAVGK